MWQSKQEVQAQLTKLQSFFESKDDGDTVSWLELEAATSIPMRPTSRGRSLARRALRRAGRPYETLVGEGVRLSAPDTALVIAHGKIRRIDGAVRSASRTQRHLQERHIEQMQEEDKRKLLTLAGFFGAVRALAKKF